jgi:hypothetical protein
MPTDALGRALRSVSRTLGDPTSDDRFLTRRSADLTVLRRLEHAPSSFRAEDLDEMSQWLQEHLVPLGVPEINRALAEGGAAKRIRLAAASHLDALERTS